MKWFEYPTYVGKNEYAPRARKALISANGIIESYAKSTGLSGMELAKYVATKEKVNIRSDAVTLNSVGQLLTRREYRHKRKQKKVQERSLSQAERTAERFYQENEDGVPDEPYGSLVKKFE